VRKSKEGVLEMPGAIIKALEEAILIPKK